METPTSIAQKQQDIGNQMSQLLKNMKKDSNERKTDKYIAKRWETSEALWNEAKTNDEEFRKLGETTHPYSTSKFFEQMKKVHEEIKTYIKALQKKQEEMKKQMAAYDMEQQRRFRAQAIKMGLLKETMEKVIGDLSQEKSKTWYESLLTKMRNLWQAVYTMNEEICTYEEEFDAEYFKNEVYKTTEQEFEEIQERLIQRIGNVTYNADSQTGVRNTPNITLPQLKIPYFDGNYDYWATFYDLFSKLIHNNVSLSEVEKMQYLKTHVRGEPKKLIQHLQINNANYQTAWNLLERRYNNTRLILAKLVDKILDLPNLQYPSADKLKILHDTTTECLEAIKNLQINTDSWGPIISRIITRKWDNETNRLYEQSIDKPHEIQELSKLMEFLETRFHSLEVVGEKRKDSYQRNQTNNNNTETLNTRECKYCRMQNHQILTCTKFKKLTAMERMQFAKEKRICKNCLNHGADKSCYSTMKCRICQLNHNTLLHIEQAVVQAKTQPKSVTKATTHTVLSAEKEQEQPKIVASNHAGSTGQSSVLLTTAVVQIMTLQGIRELFRVLIDPGSQASLITERAAQILGTPKQKIHAEVTGLGDSSPKISKSKINVRIMPHFPSEFSIIASLIILPKLTQELPQESFETKIEDWKNYTLADTTFNTRGPIDIILGAKEYGQIVQQGLHKSESGLVAQKTEFGWILSGAIPGSYAEKIQVKSMMMSVNEDKQLTKFWEIENVEEPKAVSNEEKNCEEFYEKTTKREENGSYTVRIPFKTNMDVMGESKSRAKARLLQLEKRFTRNPELHEDYKKFMEEYIKLGHMKQVPEEKQQEGIYYIPHQPVIRESSTTTKLRVVFDASCKTSEGVNLNEIIHWDEPVPDEIYKKWALFQNQLQCLEEIHLPRWINYDPPNEMELHGYCDASEKTYGAVIYIKMVAPIKGKTTFPRLELCTAVLLSKIIKKTVVALEIKKMPIFAWSDSMVTLSWIRSNPSRWKAFVANRVSEITALVPSQNWHYVKTDENPADYISRGVDPSKLKKLSLWWNGPKWLAAAETKVPENNREKFVEPQEERKKYVAMTIKVQEGSIIDRFSSLTRMLRVLAYCKRFLNKCRNQSKQSGPLQVQEIEDIMIQIARDTQQNQLRNEYDMLQRKKQIDKKSKILNLSPFLDENGLMRVGGRLRNAPLSYNTKHPIILPNDCHLAKLIIANGHQSVLHGGTQATLAYIRRKFWIINGKKAVKYHIQKCTKCLRFKAETAQQKMGDLPSSRVTPSPPFTHTGIDYAGPILIRATKGRGHKSYKGYIAVFVCFATKAIHLEVVSDMTTDSFLAAFRRFVGRRGSPSHIYSDNGTTFVGASRILQRENKANINDAEVQDYLATSGTQWHFIPPSSPHFGGLWEAGVKSMKHHLKRVTGDSTLTFEELSTLMCQIEACLNSRPLTALPNDSSDAWVLTPGHFLVGRELVSPPDPIQTPITSNLSSRWRMLQKTKRDFWQAWSSEYINRLQQRYKWKMEKDNVQAGDIVLIKEEIHPSKWPLARISEIHPGKDGAVRVVSLQRAGGAIVKRTINKIIPLPIEKAVEEDGPAVKAAVNLSKIKQITSDQVNIGNNSPRVKEKQERIDVRTKGISNLMGTLLLVLLLATSFATVKAAEAADKFKVIYPPPGMYVEHVGQATIDRGVLRVEIRLSKERLHEDVKAASHAVGQMAELCENTQKLMKTSETMCNNLLHHLRELEKQAIWIESSIFSITSRQERGLLGKLLTSIFGVNDEVYQDIQDLDKNQQELIKASNHQTKFMLSTLAEFNATESRIDERLKHFHEKLNEGLKVVQEMKTWWSSIDENQLRIHIILSYEVANNFMNEIISHYTRVLNVQGRQGSFYELSSHHHVSQVIAKVSRKLPSNIEVLSIPLLHTRTKISNEFIHVYGHFAITEKADYILLKVTPVPLKIEDKAYWILDLSPEIIAVDYNTQHYFQIADSELKKTIQLNEDNYLCSPTVIKSIEENKNCIIDEIYNKMDKKTCGIRKVKISSIVWKQLYKQNSWMYITNKPTTVALICNGKREDITLNQTGILQISQECFLKTKQNILTAKRTEAIRVVEGFSKHIPVTINTSWVIPHHQDSIKTDEEPLIELSEKFGKIMKDEEQVRDELDDTTWRKIRHHNWMSSSTIGAAVAIPLIVA